MDKTKQKLSGMLLAPKGQVSKTLITSIPIYELVHYFSVENLLPELRWFFDSAVNSKNIEIVRNIQDDLEEVVVSNVASAPVSLTFAINGRPSLSKTSSGSATLEYTVSDSFIVGNVLSLVAICKVLGLKTVLFSSRLSAKEARLKSEFRQCLSMLDIEIRVVFNDDIGFVNEQLVELFKRENLYSRTLSLPHVQSSKSLLQDDNFPLKPYVEQLKEEANLNSFGGVSSDSKHVKVTDSYITTQYILFKMIVGAVAGVSTQAYSKMTQDIMLPEGKSISSILSSGYLDNISVFLQAWLLPLQDKFTTNRSGYHLSPQVWFALGLVVHHLVKSGASTDVLEKSGKAIGNLDYNKHAAHWGRCLVMELDSKGRVYKNAANSTKEFRVGLCTYFLQILESHTET